MNKLKEYQERLNKVIKEIESIDKGVLKDAGAGKYKAILKMKNGVNRTYILDERLFDPERRNLKMIILGL